MLEGLDALLKFTGEIQQPAARRDNRLVAGAEMFLAAVRLCFSDIVALSLQ